MLDTEKGGQSVEKRTDNATKTISMVMILTLLGKVMGLYRDHLLALHYGMGMEANAFYTASRIPRVFFDAMFASAISACFIPVFSEYLTKEGKEKAFSFSRTFLTAIGILAAVLSAAGMMFSGGLTSLFADGYNAETMALAVSLTRVMFPTVFFTGIAFSFVGILQSLDEFKIPALISAVSNAVIIVYFLCFDRSFGIYGLAVAFLVGWFLQAVIQIPKLRKLGFRYHPEWELRSEGMGKVFALMGPVMVSAWVQPINLTINSRFGSHLYDGAGVSAIEYSTNLYLVVAGVFILSVTNVIFPKLSRLTADGQQTAIRETVRQTLHASLFFVLPMSAGLACVAKPLVSFLYGGGAFDDRAVEITSGALALVSLGMAGYAVQNILSRVYFARQDGRAPLIAGGVSILVNFILCVVLTGPWQVNGLAAASAVSATVSALLLLIPLAREDKELLGGGFGMDILKMLLAAVLMFAAVTALSGVLMPLLPAGRMGQLFSLGISAAVGLMVYFAAAYLLHVSEARLSARLITQLLKRGN